MTIKLPTIIQGLTICNRAYFIIFIVLRRLQLNIWLPKKKQTFKFKCFSIYRLNAKEKWVIFSKAKKCLICIFDCYNLKPNTETLPDLRWSSFRRQLTVGSKYLPLIRNHKFYSNHLFFCFFFMFLFFCG